MCRINFKNNSKQCEEKCVPIFVVFSPIPRLFARNILFRIISITFRYFADVCYMSFFFPHKDILSGYLNTLIDVRKRFKRTRDMSVQK